MDKTFKRNCKIVILVASCVLYTSCANYCKTFEKNYIEVIEAENDNNLKLLKISSEANEELKNVYHSYSSSIGSKEKANLYEAYKKIPSQFSKSDFVEVCLMSCIAKYGAISPSAYRVNINDTQLENFPWYVGITTKEYVTIVNKHKCKKSAVAEAGWDIHK